MTNYDKELIVEWGKAFVSAAIAFIMLLLACVMCGCRTTRNVPAETVRTEYKDRVNTEYVVDSVTDTRFVYVKGDTVIDWRDRVKWKEREVHDSIYVNRTDTIRIPYPVERKLTKWEQTKMDFGGLMLGAVGALIIAVAILAWMALRKRKV